MKCQPGKLSLILQDLGFAQGNQMRLYGQSYQVDSDPMVLSDDLVLIDAIEIGSGERKRVRIPLPVVRMATERAA